MKLYIMKVANSSEIAHYQEHNQTVAAKVLSGNCNLSRLVGKSTKWFPNMPSCKSTEDA